MSIDLTPDVATERLRPRTDHVVRMMTDSVVARIVIHFGGTIEYFVNSTFNVPTMSEAHTYAAYDGLNVGR